jgi:hypothetical protein
VPEAPTVAPEMVELIEPAAIAVPAVPVEGADTVPVGAFVTTVEAIPDPQVLTDAVSFASPP